MGLEKLVKKVDKSRESGRGFGREDYNGFGASLLATGFFLTYGMVDKLPDDFPTVVCGLIFSFAGAYNIINSRYN